MKNCSLYNFSILATFSNISKIAKEYNNASFSSIVNKTQDVFVAVKTKASYIVDGYNEAQMVTNYIVTFRWFEGWQDYKYIEYNGILLVVKEQHNIDLQNRFVQLTCRIDGDNGNV